MNRWFGLLLIAVMTAAWMPLTSSSAAAVTEIIYRDEFNTQGALGYSGNDGTQPWATDWYESGGTSPETPPRWVTADGAEQYVLSHTHCVVFGCPFFSLVGAGMYVERSADLSVLDAPWLTFDYRQDGMDGSVRFILQVSTDGSSWDTVWSRSGTGTDAAYVPVGIDLSSYRGSTTTIRFTYVGGSDGVFAFNLDNVQIAERPNRAPVAVDDVASTAEDSAVTVAVLGNDSDPDGDALAVDSVTQGSHGSVTNNGSNVTYDPDQDWSGTDAFTYKVSDGNGGLSGWATVSVTVAAQPDAPVAVDDAASTDEDAPVNIWVLSNDSDPDLDALSVSGVTNGEHGSVTNHGYKVTYAPEADWSGTDSFDYSVSDGNGGTATATVSVTVAAQPDAPVGVDDVARTDEDTPVNVWVLGNDSDADGDGLSVAGVNGGDHGVVVNHGVKVTYAPVADFFGTDLFSYTVTDGKGGSASAWVTVTDLPVNDDPLAEGDQATTPNATAVTVEVLDNDTDPEGDVLAIAETSQGGNGVVVTDGVAVTYLPSPGWAGVDSFTYTITDGNGGSDTATVEVTVEAANQPPSIDVSGETEGAEGEPLEFLVTAADPDEDPISIELSDLPAWCRTEEVDLGLAITCEPGFDTAGSYEITITASDGDSSVTSRRTIEVVDVNRPPQVGPVRFSGVGADGSFSFTVNATDEDGDILAFTADGMPAWATLTAGEGEAVVGSAGVPLDATGSLFVALHVSDGVHTVTVEIARTLADLRVALPVEKTHLAFQLDEEVPLVATALKPRVASPDPPRTNLTPREGLMVAFGSAVETLGNQILPAVILGVVMAWMLMIGVGRVKDEEESA
jgi:hypothetical protein